MRKNGERVWMEWTNSGIYDVNGNLRELLSVGIDATDRKRAEEALRQSEERYRVLHESLRDAFVQASMDGRIVECNDLYCRMLGYSPEEMRALTYQELTPERWHAFEDGIVGEQIIPRGYSDVYEKEYRRKDGTIIPVELRTILSRDAFGQPNAMWAIVRDITERKRAEEALRRSRDELELRVQGRTAELTQANEALKASERQLRILSSRILSAHEEERKRIAHELHDSIGGVLSAIKFELENTLNKLREGKANPEDLEKLVGTTHYAMEEARRIYMDLRPSVLDDLGLVATVGWFARQFQSHYQNIDIQRAIELTEDEIPELLKIVLFRVMQEAFHNVAKHSQATLVDFSLTREDNRLTLTISDNGEGFAPVDPSGCESTGGGLGLVSMQERVESSGGVLLIRSSKGMGTTIQAMWDLIGLP
jgi:PAS domain S-box-containing protein